MLDAEKLKKKHLDKSVPYSERQEVLAELKK